MSAILADLRAAVAFLTIIPVGYPQGRKPGYSFAYFPLVGLIIGLALVVILTLPIRPDLRSFMALITWVILTGGLHLDGFGDSCDGLIATVTPERRLEIMKDPRAGNWAVVGLILLLLGKYILLREILPLHVLAVPIAGRWAMVMAARIFPYARTSGLGGYFRDGLGNAQLIIATIFVVVFIAVMSVFDRSLLIVLILPPLIVLGVGKWAAGRLGGGLTGDVYGALCELTELISLLGMAL